MSTNRAAVLLLILLIGSVRSQVDGQVADVVARVSTSQYQDFHLDIENMGLGLYGGANFNMGFRNRDGTAGAGSLGNQEARLFLQDTLAGMGLSVSTQGIYRNVVGELPGLTTPDRVFIIGGHYDHVAGDRPGGDDNASGTAGFLEAARVLSQFRFDATIRFIGFNAEEDGLLGSAHYVSNQVVAHAENVVGMVSLDMILRPAWDQAASVIDVDLQTRTSHPASVAWAQQYQQAAAAFVPSLVVDSSITNLNGGSDQDPFVTAGYPAFLAIENTAQEIWSGSNAYYHGDQDASDRLANDPNSPSGVTYDYAFATDVVRASVALIAQEAGLRFERTPCDFNVDGLCELADLNELLQQGPVEPGVPAYPAINNQYDLTGDGRIDNLDVDEWLALAAQRRGFSSPYLRGDGNLDGEVDGSDFNLWNNRKFTATLRWDEGDFNGDGLADGTDFNQWNSHKFTSSDRRTMVPEPCGTTLVVVLAFLLRAWCRRDASPSGPLNG